ncbi:TonB-dependent receptor [Sphingomonas sp. So64.6b]|uniref:TonB-dependent receptor n=1 Tax=Sphingomonas sp. So64.6b TaxID=2997354 RepID=UPI0016046130|nr:TonB-dependent receptor [Sphingomonas sp. So64.6b]QNA86466.1 TonB-dependent receptor [Sphingomonas sp. So64.6b]
MKRSYRRALFLSSAAGLVLMAQPVFAKEDPTEEAAPVVDEAGDDAGGEIVVTARRQSERAQDVPIALSVLTGASLERTGGYTLTDVQFQTPSLTAYNSNPRNSSIGIRGIGVSSASDGLDTSVGVYIDNVYLGRPGMALSDLIDVDRVEVLRGPQGTLFGRNNSAGVLNITTRKPEFTFGGTAELSAGNYSYNQERISITGPLIDGLLAFRVTGFNTHRDGVFDNIKTGIGANSVGRSGGRIQLLATPASNFTLRLSADYSIEDDTCCVSATKLVLPASLSATTNRTLQTLAALGYVPAPNNYSQNNALQNMKTDQKGVSLQADWDLGFASLTSITAWRYWHFNPLQDSDGTPLDVIQVNVAQTKDDQYSQEVRLASPPGRFSWQVGAYLFHQKLKDHFILNQFGTDASNFYTTYARFANPAAPAIVIAPGSQYLDDVDTTVDSVAAFAQANFSVTDRLTLTGGIRYTHDKRSGTSDTSTIGTPYVPTSIPFHYDVSVTDDNVSYLASISYKLADDVLTYASYSTGYKGSGLNLNSAVSAGTPLVLAPEKVRNWELGLKSQFFDRRLTLNLSGFSTNLSGLQANIVPTNGNRSYLANVGDVRSRGVEVDASLRATDNLTISANGSYNDATYKSYANAPCPVGVTGICDLTGKPLFQAPKWVGNATIDYHFELANEVRPYALAQVSYRSSTFGTADAGPYSRIDSYALANFRIGAAFGKGRYDLSAWVNNVFDKKYFQNLSTTAIVGTSPFAYSGQLGTPRTAGATLRVNF